MSSGRVGQAFVITCFFTAGYGRHRKLGVGFRTAGYDRHRSQWVNSRKKRPGERNIFYFCISLNVCCSIFIRLLHDFSINIIEVKFDFL